MSGFVTWMENWLQSEAPTWSDLYLRVNSRPVVKLSGMGLKVMEASPLVREDDLEYLVGGKVDWSADVDQDHGVTVSGLRFRVNVLKSMGGGGAVLRRLETEPPELDGLGLPTNLLRRICQFSHGLIIVAGETGSGKTTTLSAMMYERARLRSTTTVTIEDPVEILFPKEMPTREGGLSQFIQREVGHDTDSFTSGLRAALREAPNVIAVGEVRDAESARLALQAAETGHLVFMTLHTRGAQETVSRLLAFFPEAQHTLIRQQLASGLRLVLRQVLMPRKGGDGRVLAYELMTLDGGIANCIRKGTDHQILNEISAGREYGMVALNDMLAKLVRDEVIERDEALRHSYDPEALDAML
ncbi:type IV pilus twitching motility protein PilT [Acidihalobacter yilgarnensis]|nr:ATPase, T2SS/T4P/T4SS family [Acidihalobacter yilgarnensis]